MGRFAQQGLNKLIALSLGLAVVYSSASMADDTEVFTAYTPIDTSANVVFIIDTSGSMGNPPADALPDTPNKIQIVKDVFEKLIFDPNNPTDHSTINPSTEGINVAIMRFDNRSGDSNKGGYFISAMKELNDANKTSIWDSVNNLAANGSTPLAETLYEASLFFDGANPKFGNATLPGTNVIDVLVSTDGPYLSPFQSQGVSEQCAINNHIVLLTDGQPTHDSDADLEINTSIEDGGLGGNCSFSSTGEQEDLVITDCLPDVAKYLNEKDFLPDDPDKDPNVRTHTIAFDLQVPAAVDLLNQTANNGGGLATSATDAMELAEAISRILSSIDDTAKTFVSPSVSLSSTYRLQHEDAMYYALFKPETSAQWTGNLKGYQLGDDGVLRDYSTPPREAIDTGPPMQFSDSARSKWSPSVDGNDLAAGGVASKLPASRTIYTHDGSDLLEFSDSTVSHTDLGVTTAEKADLIQWAKGLDAGGEIRPNPIGDPLHSTPIVVDYGASGGKIIFFGTNQGFLHAIDADTGEEVFAFIPKELLGNLKTFKANTAGVHPYGLDGPITAFVDDADHDGIIETGETFKVYLYIGMRRGGNQYYALDVSNVNTPSFLWQINPDAENSVFSQMGQSWSKPIVTKIKSGDKDTPTEHDVLLFAGGYDPDYDPQLPDTPHPTVTDAAGAAIYAVDAVTGELKWKASAATPPGGLALPGVEVDEMVNSIPSDLAILDLDGTLDHFADRIYAADILGNIFRFDLNNVDEDTDTFKPTGKLLANLSGDNRRFYHSPETVLTRNGLRQYVTINIGSGYRAHPLYVSGSSIKDRFYSIQDDHIFAPLPDGYTAFDNSNLVEVSTIDTTTVITKGWYYELTEPGEKVLAKSTTTNNQIIFTTYTPPTAPNTPSCSPPLGTGRYYAANLFTPKASITEHELSSSGIPPAPSVIINGGGTVTIQDPDNPDGTITRRLTPRVQLCVGVECETLNTDVILDRTFWQQLL